MSDLTHLLQHFHRSDIENVYCVYTTNIKKQNLTSLTARFTGIKFITFKLFLWLTFNIERHTSNTYTVK